MKPKSARRPAAAKKGHAPGLTREQIRVIWSALGVAVIAVVVISWRTLFPIAPDRLVEVAWTHECSCAEGWMRSLRNAGFVVRDFELADLRTIRRQWQVPPTLKGCHPAKFMGYVIDGHVPADMLRKLAKERPPASAVVQTTRQVAVDDDDPTAGFALIDVRGTLRPWP